MPLRDLEHTRSLRHKHHTSSPRFHQVPTHSGCSTPLEHRRRTRRPRRKGRPRRFGSFGGISRGDFPVVWGTGRLHTLWVFLLWVSPCLLELFGHCVEPEGRIRQLLQSLESDFEVVNCQTVREWCGRRFVPACLHLVQPCLLYYSYLFLRKRRKGAV